MFPPRGHVWGAWERKAGAPRGRARASGCVASFNVKNNVKNNMKAKIEMEERKVCLISWSMSKSFQRPLQQTRPHPSTRNSP